MAETETLANLDDATTLELLHILARNGNGAQAIVDQWRKLGDNVIWPVYLNGIISSAIILTGDKEGLPLYQWRSTATFVVNFIGDLYLWTTGLIYPQNKKDPRIMWFLVDVNNNTFRWDYQA